MRVTNLFCIHCGEKSAVDIMPDGEPVPCRSCGKQTVDFQTLMLASGILDVTLKICGGCNKSALVHNKFCYHCGNQIS